MYAGVSSELNEILISLSNLHVSTFDLNIVPDMLKSPVSQRDEADIMIVKA